mmetsp:Transcript_13151/g.21840  ORF Transcript_13151/g.21840 Transcript_13151/m.21840 type:complete len:238 (+) Transcript_13151:1000-1713(+)
MHSMYTFSSQYAGLDNLHRYLGTVLRRLHVKLFDFGNQIHPLFHNPKGSVSVIGPTTVIAHLDEESRIGLPIDRSHRRNKPGLGMLDVEGIWHEGLTTLERRFATPSFDGITDSTALNAPTGDHSIEQRVGVGIGPGKLGKIVRRLRQYLAVQSDDNPARSAVPNLHIQIRPLGHCQRRRIGIEVGCNRRVGKAKGRGGGSGGSNGGRPQQRPTAERWMLRAIFCTTGAGVGGNIQL